MSLKFEIKNKGGKAQLKVIGAIDWWKNSSNDFTRQIDQMIADGLTDVEAYINTPGGSMWDSNEIGNQITRFSGAKSCKLGALCASAGTTLSTYFDTIEASDNTQYMIHDPAMIAQMQHLNDFDSNRQMYENMRNGAIDRYVAKTGLSRDEISTMMEKTTWMNATTAKAKKFVDSISKEKGVMPPDTKNAITQYGYVNVPEVVNIELNPPETPSMKKLATKYGLPENATEDEILAAVEKAENTAKLKAEGNTESGIKALVVLGVAKGLKKEHVEKLAKADFDTTMEMVMNTVAPSDTPPPAAFLKEAPETTRLTDVLAALKNSLPAAAPDMKFSEKLTKDKKGLQAMLSIDPQKVVTLFLAEYPGTPVTVEELRAVIG